MNHHRIATGVSLLLLGFLAAGCGGESDEPGAAAGLVLLTATVETDPALRAAGRMGFTAPVDVAAVDETGIQADAALGVTGDFTLTLPAGHDYVLIFSDARGAIGALVYRTPVGERPDYRVRTGVSRLDLGALTVDPEGRRVRAESPSAFRRPASDPAPDLDGDGISNRDDDESAVDHPLHGAGALGAPLVGQAIYQDERNACVGCHGETGGGATVAPNSIRGTSIEDLAEALASGAGDEDGFMPVFSDLVKFAPDIAAFLQVP